MCEYSTLLFINKPADRRFYRIKIINGNEISAFICIFCFSNPIHQPVFSNIFSRPNYINSLIYLGITNS